MISLLRGRMFRNWVIEFRPFEATQYLHVQCKMYNVQKPWKCWLLKVKVPRYLELSESFYPVTHHVSEERRPQPHRCEHLWTLVSCTSCHTKLLYDTSPHFLFQISTIQQLQLCTGSADVCLEETLQILWENKYIGHHAIVTFLLTPEISVFPQNIFSFF